MLHPKWNKNALALIFALALSYILLREIRGVKRNVLKNTQKEALLEYKRNPVELEWNFIIYLFEISQAS